MPAAQGNKDQSFLTAKEKWLIGIFIATGVTAILTFVVTLVLIVQLKDSINTSEIDDLRQDFQNRTANLENQMLQNQKETENLRLEFQYIKTELNNEMIQYQNEAEDFQSNMTQLLQGFQSTLTSFQNRLNYAVASANKLLNYEKLDKEGWKKLSNGLRYKLFDGQSNGNYATADAMCQKDGARLASTGIRSAAIRSEIRDEFSGNKAWIGLRQWYHHVNWYWSDANPYKNTDFTWAWDSCRTQTGLRGVIGFDQSRDYIYCYAFSDIYGYICEI